MSIKDKLIKYRIVIAISVISILLIAIVCRIFAYQSRDYKVKLYLDHAEIVRYIGKKSDVVIPDRLWGKRVTVIGDRAFKNNYRVKSVIISDNVEEIGQSAFYSCSNLENVTCGKNLKKICYSAFWDCSELKNVSLNEGLIVIDICAFSGAKKLKTIEIPSTVEDIEWDAFLYSGLENIVFKGDKTYVKRSALKATPWFENQEGYVICGDSVLIAYNGDEEVLNIPSGVKHLCFSVNENVKEVYIPDTVTTIYDEDDSLFTNDMVIYMPANDIEIYYGVRTKEYVKDVNIVTTAGSYAEQIAKEYGMQCTIVDEIVYPEN